MCTRVLLDHFTYRLIPRQFDVVKSHNIIITKFVYVIYYFSNQYRGTYHMGFPLGRMTTVDRLKTRAEMKIVYTCMYIEFSYNLKDDIFLHTFCIFFKTISMRWALYYTAIYTTHETCIWAHRPFDVYVCSYIYIQ